MSLEITEKDQKKFEAEANRNPVCTYLKNQASMRFNIGDILIRQHTRYKDGEYTWVTEKVSDVSNAPKKFMYVYETEYGVGFLKQLKSGGTGFTTSIICMANVSPHHTRYVIDPDYADHVLLDGDKDSFQAQSFFKEDKARRRKIMEHNKSLMRPTNTWALCNEIIAGMQPKDRFWYGYSPYDCVDTEWEVISVKKQTMGSISSYDRGRNDGTTNDYYTVEVKRLGSYNYNDTITTSSMHNKYVCTVKPTPYKDNM